MTDVFVLRRRSLRWLALVGVLVALAVPGAVGMAADPEPTVVEFPASNYDPGPGWPAGWAPVAAPTEISDEVRQGWEEIRTMMAPPKPDTLEMRVYGPMPEWTSSYPYMWRTEFVTCGTTTYAYYYPFPDTDLYFDTYNATITAAKGIEPGCAFAPVRSIRKDREVTPEEQEQFRLANKMDDDFLRARGGFVSQGGLDGCNFEKESTFDNILVCLNNGDASEKFDVPAYNDTTVGRVRVPVRFVSEMMGAEVTWDQPTWTVTIVFPAETRTVVHPVSLPGFEPRDWFSPESLVPDRVENYKLEDRPVTQPGRIIQLKVKENVALVDGELVPLDAPPVLLPPGRVMVPIRFVAEQMGAKVYWTTHEPIFKRGDQFYGRFQVHIYTPFHPYFEYPSWPLENRAIKF